MRKPSRETYIRNDAKMKPRILDLFCGAGGAAMGLYQAGFEIVGVDIKPQPRYPFEFHLGNALTYPLEGFDAYWASPPCQAYMDTNKNGRKPSKHPRLIEPLRELLGSSSKPYIIENTERAPIDANLMLCGTMFGLPLIRHRFFHTSFPPPMAPASCNHWGTVAHGDFAAVYAKGGKEPRHGPGVREASPLPCKTTPEAAMGIVWMSERELQLAIPPAYSRFIGEQLMKALKCPLS